MLPPPIHITCRPDSRSIEKVSPRAVSSFSNRRLTSAASSSFDPKMLRQNFIHHLYVVGGPYKPFIKAIVEVRECLGVEAEEIEQRGVEVANVNRIFGGAEAD